MVSIITKFVLCLLLIINTHFLAQAQTYSPLTLLGVPGSSGNQSNRFTNPHDVVIASDGKIFVADGGNYRVSVWTQSGNTFGNLTTFGAGTNGSALDQFEYTSGLDIDKDGKILICDEFNNRICVWTQSGVTFGVLTIFGTGTAGSGANQFNRPTGISIAKDGKIFISDKSNSRVSVWTQTGSVFGNVATFGTSGTLPNQFGWIEDISVAPDNKIYVADYNNHRICVWTYTGNTFGYFTSFGTGVAGAGNNQFNNPYGVEAHADGRVFIADYRNQRVSIWKQNGSSYSYETQLGVTTVSSNSLGFLNSPNGIGVAPDGKVYVAANHIL